MIILVLFLAALYYLTHRGAAQNLVGFVGFSFLVLLGGLGFYEFVQHGTPQTSAEMGAQLRGLIGLALGAAALVGLGWLLFACLANYLWDADLRKAAKRHLRQLEIQRQMADIAGRRLSTPPTARR